MEEKNRIVIKVGSAVLTQNNDIVKHRMLALVSLVAKLKETFDVILVSSGAVASGYSALRLDKSKQISKKAIAATGQPILMSSYKRKFDIFNIDTAQILLTEDDFDSRKRTKMFQEIIGALLENNILPIVNENDISSTPEQLFGDNDQLSAHVAEVLNAELLVIFSDIDGYYDKNPSEYEDAKLFKVLNSIPKEALEQEASPNDEFATGGIVTKLKAADYLLRKNKKMFLASGFDLDYTKDFLLKGSHTKGTLFTPKEL
ncbi:MAG: glutamate 5-kinase [Sulfurimonas sp.]|jgi:glutamate 5-kinase|nr:glutamate 5-kinase [Sulfurimonadaceae bacterium]